MNVDTLFLMHVSQHAVFSD